MLILRTTNERYKNINQLRFVYHNANDVCILDTFDILIIIMVVLKMLCDQKAMFGLHPAHTHDRSSQKHPVSPVQL